MERVALGADPHPWWPPMSIIDPQPPHSVTCSGSKPELVTTKSAASALHVLQTISHGSVPESVRLTRCERLYYDINVRFDNNVYLILFAGSMGSGGFELDGETRFARLA